MKSTSLFLPLGQPRSLQQTAHVRNDLRLLEVSGDILDTLVKEGMIIKGSEDDEAVICSGTRTYALKFVETTNTLLLVQPEQHILQMDVDNGFDDQDDERDTISSAPGLQTQVQQLHEGAARLPAVTVYATSKAHIEVLEVAPKLQLLHELLAQRPYTSEEEEDGPEAGQQGTSTTQDDDVAMIGSDQGRFRHGLYTLPQLMERVQASEGELLAELVDMHALELDGCWRVVGPGYLGNLLELVILTAQAEGMPLQQLRLQQLVDVLVGDGIRPELTCHCLKTFGSPATGGAGGSAGAPDHAGPASDVWELNERKVCIHFAEKLLRTPCPATLDAPVAAGDSGEARRVGAASEQELLGWSSPYVWPQAAFLSAWAQAVPAEFTPELDMLAGEVIMEGKGNVATVQLFSVRYLPSNPRDRFHALFSLRPRWEARALEPFLAGLKAPGKTAGALLLQYARASQPTPDSPVYYTCRD